MNTPHALRNWLHHLVLAVQAADAKVVANSFARTQPLAVTGPRPADSWTDWAEWAAFVQGQLAPFRPGSIGLHFLQTPDIQVEETRAALHWQLACRLPTQPPSTFSLDCEATLAKEGESWVATRLHARLLTPS